MKVTVKSFTEAERANRDYRDILRIDIDDKEVFKVIEGEPEDATLSRDFNDCWKIADLLELAHKAGAKGESFKVEMVTVTLDEIW